MPERMTTTDLKSTLAFPFSHPEWRRRFVLGAALILAAFVIPIIPLVFVYGYLLRVLRDTAEGKEPALPAWDDWGRLGLDGVRATVVTIVATLPGWVILLVGAVFYFFAVTAAGAGPYGDQGAALSEFWTIIGGMGIMYLAMALGMLLLAIGVVPMPMALAHLAVEDRLGAAFRLREWWRLIRVARWEFFAAWVIVVGLGAISYWCTLIPSYTVVLCCLTPLIGAPLALYVGLVGAAAFGSVYVRAEQGAESEEAPADEENGRKAADSAGSD